MDAYIQEVTETGSKPPRLLLHSCCAPCSSYCIEYLCEFLEITVFYYNPNISESEEYKKRVVEQKRLIECYNSEIVSGSRKGFKISVVEGDYDPQDFFDIAKGYENCPERGERCHRCYELRLRRTAEYMRETGGFDRFATTLTLSPLKDSAKINEIGERLSAEYGVKFLVSDFKKKNGYLRSIELSKEYDLYRQDYCGCVYSKAQRQREKAEKERKQE